MKKQWWQSAVAYQIYPKSFMDSNGDGIGDIPGIISKLDYLKDLGINLIWLSPMYPTPLADQGYDISDYYGIDPRFGTMEDMDNLIAECKKRDMRLILDLVVNHCSDEHEWFKQAVADPEGKYGKYFYLEDIKENGELPTNWRSYFGGPVWDRLGDTDKFYLHVFHKKQPDLNWENPELREEIYKIVNWWLDKGIAGFRVDAIINIKKALPLRSYPANRDDGLCDIDKMLEEAEGIGEFLTELRERTFISHNAFSVGEVFNVGKDRMREWIGEDGYFSSMFDFGGAIFGEKNVWHDKEKITAEAYKNLIFGSQEIAGDDCFMSNIIENHDEPRGVNYYLPDGEINEYSKKMLGGLYFMLRGIPFIYQGQELGMENTVFNSIEDVDDISTLDQYQIALDAGLSQEEAMKAVSCHSRDNVRTPMQWTDNTQAGFTSGIPWLKVNPNYKDINAASQMVDDGSILSFYKKMIRLRKSAEYGETLVYGETIPYLREQKNLIAYLRNGEKKILVIGNFQSTQQTISIPSEKHKMLLNNYSALDISENLAFLRPYQFVILELLM